MSLIQGVLSLVSTHNAGGSEINFRIGDNLNVVTVASPDWSEVTPLFLTRRGLSVEGLET